MRIKLQVPVTPQWERALARAAADRLAGRVPERIGSRTYRMASGSGNPDHIITIQSVVNLQATCDCIAGQRGLVCRHAAACLDAALTRIAHSDDAVAAPAPTYGPAQQTASENDRKMARFARM